MNLFIVPAMIRNGSVFCSIQVINAQSREVIKSFPYPMGDDQQKEKAYLEAMQYAEKVKNGYRGA